MKTILTLMIVALLVTPAFAEHPCKKGPVKITISVPGGDCNTCTASTTPNADGSYTQGPTICTVLDCTHKEQQEWTDYPECDGKQIVKEPSLTTDAVNTVIKPSNITPLPAPGHAK